jgi:hypothetical protein
VLKRCAGTAKLVAPDVTVAIVPDEPAMVATVVITAAIHVVTSMPPASADRPEKPPF